MKLFRAVPPVYRGFLPAWVACAIGCSSTGSDGLANEDRDSSATADARGGASGASSGSGLDSGSGATSGSRSGSASGSSTSGLPSASGSNAASGSAASGSTFASGSVASSGLDAAAGADSSGSSGVRVDAGLADAHPPNACPAPPASEPAQSIIAVNAVNAVRSQMGLQCSTLVPTLDVAALAHCHYYAANAANMACTGNPHVEVMSCPNFDAANFWTRDANAGYAGGRAGAEVMDFSGNAAMAVQRWIDSVWHRTPLLSPWMRDLGYGGTTTPNACDTIDLGTGATTSDAVTALYPYDGQTNVPTSFDGSFEGPTPPAPPSGWPSGYPVHLYLRSGTVQSHKIVVDGSTVPLAHVWIDQTNTTNGPDQFILYADAPLTANTTYRVQIGAMRGTTPVNFDWKFTTGPR